MGLEIEDDEQTPIFRQNKVSSRSYTDIVAERDFVDLGLPSGTMWCKFNIGATCGDTPESWYGNYFAWGEIEPKKTYNWETYKHCNVAVMFLTKYNFDPKYGKVDNKRMLDPEDDVVTTTFGTRFKTPSTEQFRELRDHTTHERVENYNGINGLCGLLFTSTINGETLFIPASGCYYQTDTYRQRTHTCLWANAIENSPISVFSLQAGPGAWGMFVHSSREYGMPVRGVLK